MITLGGDAELELVDSLDPFSEGIVFRLITQYKKGILKSREGNTNI